MDLNRLADEVPSPDEGDDWIAIGEALSAEDVHWASVTLFELGIECLLALGDSEVDEIRRVLEGWTAGQRLLVKPEDAARAIAAVQSKVVPTQYWTDTELYLKQQPTNNVLKILDFPDSWSQQIRDTATRVLAERGITYPPEGVYSSILPVSCLIIGALFGPLAGLLRFRIDRMNAAPTGGKRPHYDETTRTRANQSILIGLCVWGTFLLGSLIARVLK